MTRKEAQPVSNLPATAREALAIAEASGGWLQKRLDLYSRYSKSFHPELHEVYEELIRRLVALKNAGPLAGAVMPDFVLPDHNGKLIRLASLIADGPVVLSLNRGHWCPWCRLELRALAQINSEVVGLGGQVVSIVPETLSYSQRMVEDNNLPFKVLTDLDLGYALSLGLVIWAGERVRELYLRGGIDLSLFQNNKGWFLPIPATFIIGYRGEVVARFVNPDFRARMEPTEILAALGSAARAR